MTRKVKSGLTILMLMRQQQSYCNLLRSFQESKNRKHLATACQTFSVTVHQCEWVSLQTAKQVAVMDPTSHQATKVSDDEYKTCSEGCTDDELMHIEMP